MATKRTAKQKKPTRAKKSTAKKATAKKATAKKATAKNASATNATASAKPTAAPTAGTSSAFFAFGQDVRLAGARAAMHSVPRSVIMGQMPAGPIPVHIDDPLGRGDSEPSGGASKLGDIVSGAFSLYSPKLQKALTDFGVKFDFKPVEVFLPGKKAPIAGYAWARGAKSIEVPSIEFFTVDPAKTEGLALFDASHNFATVRVVTAELKAHLEAAGLEGVYFVPTKEYGGMLAMVLQMG